MMLAVAIGASGFVSLWSVGALADLAPLPMTPTELAPLPTAWQTGGANPFVSFLTNTQSTVVAPQAPGRPESPQPVRPPVSQTIPANAPLS